MINHFIPKVELKEGQVIKNIFQAQIVPHSDLVTYTYEKSYFCEGFEKYLHDPIFVRKIFEQVLIDKDM